MGISDGLCPRPGPPFVTSKMRIVRTASRCRPQRGDGRDWEGVPAHPMVRAR
jgi:hypothetical protein